MARGDYNRIPATSFIGKKYEKLTITKEVTPMTYTSGASFRRVEAICECGIIKVYFLMNILHSKSISCGCQRRINPNHKTHGLSKTELYRIYNDIITRCYNENSTPYPYYGGIGIIMCDEWKNNFIAFYDWCISNGWRNGLEIDKDKKYKEKHGTSPGKIYSPEYCSFLTHKQNSRSRKSNVLMTFNGETKSATEWAEQYGISQKTFDGRRKRGWVIERILTTKIGSPRGRYAIKK